MKKEGKEKKNDKSIGYVLFDEFVQRLLETKSKNVTQNDILIFSIWNSKHVKMESGLHYYFAG